MKTRVCLLSMIMLVLNGVTAVGQHFTNFTKTDGLPSNNVNGVAVDSRNHKWFATQEGVARYNDTAWTIYTRPDGLIDDYINCIAVDANDHIWAGTDVGVSTFNGSSWTSYTPSDGLVNSVVNYIAGAPDGSVWIGTGAGLSHFDGTTWQNFTTASGLPADMVSYIAAESGGVIWIGTWIGGLARYDGSAFTYFTTADSLPSDNVSALAIDGENRKWIGTYNGVALFGSDNKWITTYRKSQGIVNNFIMDIDIDSRGTVWFGNYDVYTMDPGISKKSTSGWRSFLATDGLIDGQVKRIAVDRNDRIWIATGSGVSKLTDAAEGIRDLSGLSAKLWPNPASDALHIDGLIKPVRLSVLSVTGRELLRQELSSGSNTIDLRLLPGGMYILRCTSGNEVYTEKLFVR